MDYFTQGFLERSSKYNLSKEAVSWVNKLTSLPNPVETLKSSIRRVAPQVLKRQNSAVDNTMNMLEQTPVGQQFADVPLDELRAKMHLGLNPRTGKGIDDHLPQSLAEGLADRYQSLNRVNNVLESEDQISPDVLKGFLNRVHKNRGGI